jgi:hypothetical protein
MTKTANHIEPGSPWALFKTDATLEQAGIKVDYGHFYFQVARAGGANIRYRDVLRSRMAPHKRAMATETMNDTLADNIVRDVFAETIVLGWGSEKHGDGKMIAEDGSAIEFSAEAVKAMFKELPDLAQDVMAQAQSMTNFRASIVELDTKN